MLTICHTVLSISRRGGGLSGVVLELSKALREGAYAVSEVMSLKDEASDFDMAMWQPIQPLIFEAVGLRAAGFSPKMLPRMMELKSDLHHSHGLWLYPSLATTCWSRRTGKPFLISPHGMLEPRIELKNSAVKKRLALWMYENRHLREARCIHALCRAEANDIREFGLKGPIAVIPNGVNVPEQKQAAKAPWADYVEPGKKVLLYLGRVTPKKGIARLVDAIAALKVSGDGMKNWCLVIAGWDQQGHTEELKARVNSLGLVEQIKFAGPLFGDDKDAAYRSASAFVLPSESEGLPLVVIEAWAYGLAVVMTPQCNIPEGFEVEAALCSQPEEVGLAKALTNLFSMSDIELIEMGKRGRELVRMKFTWEKVALQMDSVYRWMVNGGAAPDCVETYDSRAREF